jgi:hypothetical protein
MGDNPKKSLQAGPEQLIYAGVLEKGMLCGMILLLVTYFIYAVGIFQAYVPLAQIPQLWSMNVHDYLTHCKIETGWSWVNMVGYGDFLNFTGIALLAGVTIICFLSIVPVLLREGDKLYAFFAVLEAVILGVAASGILGAGGH